MSRDVIKEIKDKFDVTPFETNDIDAGVRRADVIYVCRIQKERFSDPSRAKEYQKTFRITPEIMEQCKKDAILLHALPKIMEIDSKVDEMECAKYFDQAFYGVPVRMAILSLLSGVVK
jgi:aspartate carbamoyltransferase catalytic subunit